MLVKNIECQLIYVIRVLLLTHAALKINIKVSGSLSFLLTLFKNFAYDRILFAIDIYIIRNRIPLLIANKLNYTKLYCKNDNLNTLRHKEIWTERETILLCFLLSSSID